MFDFISEANKVHHGKYDYSKSEYIGKKKKLCIICPEHGEFWQTPYQHVHGQGCPICGNRTVSEKLKFSKEKVFEMANEIHNGKYDYSKAEYVNMNTKFCIICPEHGEFWQFPNNHISKRQGCPACAGHVLTKEMFVERANQKHNFKYDYSKVEFKRNKDKITIICPEHGEFEQTVNTHLNGCGCQICGKERIADKRRKPHDEVIEDFIKIHGDRYDYSNVEYINNHTKIRIICKKHGEFCQTPNNHLFGVGCPKCKQSYGENEISLYLKSKGIKFTQEKTFDWLKFRRKQKLDFYLDDYNAAIEFQGEQHFRPVRYWNYNNPDIAKKSYEKVVEYDSNKQELCNEHGVHIFYITYKDSIIEELDKIIEKINPQ